MARRKKPPNARVRGSSRFARAVAGSRVGPKHPSSSSAPSKNSALSSGDGSVSVEVKSALSPPPEQDSSQIGAGSTSSSAQILPVPVETSTLLSPETTQKTPLLSNLVSESSSTRTATTTPDVPPQVVVVTSIGNSPVLRSEDTIKTPNSNLPWATKFKASLHNLKQMSAPTYLDDGTPVVVAPPSVLLKAADMWKGHIVAQFHGLAPSAAKIYSDLNPVWGRFGNITVRMISETASLIFIPSLATREWVLEIGFWQAGNCSCTVYPWSPEGPLQLEELKTAPTWAILKNVPPQLYSLEGISVIASGIGKPLHTEKSRLDPVNIGATKVKVVIDLGTTLPEAVVVKDVQGNTARVAVEYPRPPPKCLNCGRYGHLLSRCPQPLTKKPTFKKDTPSGSKEVSHPTVSLPVSKPSDSSAQISQDSLTAPRITKPRRKRSRSRKRSSSTPPKIYEPVPLEVNHSVISSSEEVKLKVWRRKVDVPSVKPLQPPPAAEITVPTKSTVLGASSVEEPPQTVPQFPIPPGWDVLSNKAKKKLKKQWHNRLNSKNLGESVPIRSKTSSGTNNH